MGTLSDFLKMIAKGILLFIGSVMLLGGGICVVTDTFFLLTSGQIFILIWLGVAALVALVGWGIVKGATNINNHSAQMKTPEEEP